MKTRIRQIFSVICIVSMFLSSFGGSLPVCAAEDVKTEVTGDTEVVSETADTEGIEETDDTEVFSEIADTEGIEETDDTEVFSEIDETEGIEETDEVDVHSENDDELSENIISENSKTLPSWQASEGFSNIQGENQWSYYYYKRRGTGEGSIDRLLDKFGKTSIAGESEDEWSYAVYSGPSVTKNTQTGSGDAGARGWTSPITGKIHISNGPLFTVYTENTGMDFMIIKESTVNNESVKTKIWERKDYNDIAQCNLSLYTQVNKDDKIFFIVTYGSQGYYTRVTWDPLIRQAANDDVAPEISPIGNQKAKVGYKREIEVVAEDLNYDELTYTATGLPEGAVFDLETRKFTWTPTASQIGTHNVTFSVSDGVLTDSETVAITVSQSPLAEIEIMSPPTRISYETGDELNIDGLVVKGIFEDNDSVILPNITENNIVGFDTYAVTAGGDTQTLIVSIEGKTDTFDITITYNELVPHIMTDPNGELEVNQEVLFTAEGTKYFGDTSDDNSDNALKLKKATYEWDFGDGYKFEGNSNSIMLTHYYMSPGVYIVKLKVSVYESMNYNEGTHSGLIKTRTIEKKVKVNGVEPLKGFELFHAPFSTRIAQFIIPCIPDAVKSDPNNRLVVTLTGSNDTNMELFNEANLSEEKEVLLEQRNLNAGDYVLTAKLLDENGEIIVDGDKQGLWIEKFSKNYNGIPKVGIDEWNAICVEGEPFFPITPWMTWKERFVGESAQFDGCINTLFQFTGYNPMNVANYEDYLETAASEGLMVIGPTTTGVLGADRMQRNYTTTVLNPYIQAGANKDAMLMHSWLDEPNMGGVMKKKYGPTMAAWKYLSDKTDGQHPTVVNMYGYSYLSTAASKDEMFYYTNSNMYSGRRSFFTDMLTSDVYPMTFRRHSYLNNRDKGIVDLMVESWDKKKEVSMDLIPTGAFIEVCGDWHVENDYDYDVPDPSEDEVLMQAWLAVANGLKMVNWFPYFNYSEIQYGAMREFTTAMATYDHIILGPDNIEQITDNSNVRTNRVDAITRKDGTDTYLFAVRLSEPEPLPEETKHLLSENIEPDSITTTFTVPDFDDGTANVLDENGDKLREIAITDGQFTDTFIKCEYHIYKIVADQVADVENRTISVSANPTYGGTVTGGGVIANGSSTILTAVANEGYEFVEWKKDGAQVGTASSLRLTNIRADASYVAYFGIAEVNEAPVLNAIGDKNVPISQELSFTVSATDADNDILRYTANGLPSGATLNEITGVFKWIPIQQQIGEYTVIITVSDGTSSDSETITITVTGESYTEHLSIQQIEDFTYTGLAITPVVEVQKNKRVLKPGVDYSVSYKKNINVGTKTATGIDANYSSKLPSVIITGKGQYKGSVKANFTIKPKSLPLNVDNDSEIGAIYKDTLEVSKKDLKPTVEITYLGKKVSSSNYTLSYQKVGEETELANIAKGSIGSYLILVKGKNNFTSTMKLPVEIIEKKVISTSKLKISLPSSVVYTGSAIVFSTTGDTPQLKITYNGEPVAITNTLGTEDGCYVKYAQNIEIGTASVTVIGTGCYEGTTKKSFKIVGGNFSKAIISLDDGDKVKAYDRMQQMLDLTGNITYKISNEAEQSYFTTKSYTKAAGGAEGALAIGDYIVLTRETDYVIRLTKGGTNAGSATYEVKGIGFFTGKKSVTTKISRVKLTESMFGAITAQIYTKGGVKPKVSGTFLNSELNTKDYSVSYKNNKAVTKEGNEAIATIKGKGNFEGSVDIKYVINPTDLSKATVVAEDIVATTKLAYKTKVALVDADNSKLSAGRDYSKNVEYYLYTSDAKWEKITEETKETFKYQLVAGAKMKAVVTGVGNYAGNGETPVAQEGVYYLVNALMKSATIVIKAQEYDGRKVVLSSEDIDKAYVKVGKKKENLIYNEDYIIDAPSTFTNVGSYSVIIKGRHRKNSAGLIYGGTKRVTVKVVKSGFTWDNLSEAIRRLLGL